jgi:mono/diheme cytochrome c family protein
MRCRLKKNKMVIATLACGMTASLLACEPKMNHGAKLRPDAPIGFFSDGALARHPVDGTVEYRSYVAENTESLTSRGAQEKLKVKLKSISLDRLKHGQARFNIYCSPCHSEIADGHGMIVRHGFLAPPSFHAEEMQKKPDSHYFDVITNGYGAMFSYADRLDVAERWDVISYIRALQLSQNFQFRDLTPEQRTQLGGQSP